MLGREEDDKGHQGDNGHQTGEKEAELGREDIGDTDLPGCRGMDKGDMLCTRITASNFSFLLFQTMVRFSFCDGDDILGFAGFRSEVIRGMGDDDDQGILCYPIEDIDDTSGILLVQG